MALHRVTALPPVGAGVRVAGGESSRRQGVERLGRLVERLDAVAAELSSTAKSPTQRTVLQTRFNDLTRQVNKLDGIVAAEGLEVRAQERVARVRGGPDPEATTARVEAPGDAGVTPPHVEVAASANRPQDSGPASDGGPRTRLDVLA